MPFLVNMDMKDLPCKFKPSCAVFSSPPTHTSMQGVPFTPQSGCKWKPKSAFSAPAFPSCHHFAAVSANQSISQATPHTCTRHCTPGFRSSAEALRPPARLVQRLAILTLSTPKLWVAVIHPGGRRGLKAGIPWL